jgi:hypothetical protein
MSPEEAEELGYVIADRLLDLYFDPEKVESAFDIEEVAEAREDRPEVLHVKHPQEDGQTTPVVIASPKKRKLKLRR